MGFTLKSNKTYKNQGIIKRKCCATILQAQVWFAKVSSIEKKTAYALDLIFVDKNDGDGTDRLRVFESIKKGMLPTRGNHKRRKFDIISIVDNSPKYKGTKEIFESPFWFLCYEKNTKLRKIHDYRNFLSKCFADAQRKFDASNERVTDERFFEFQSQVQYSNKPTRLIKVLIPKFLLTKTTFDNLAILGGLYREAYLSCSDNYAKAIKDFYIEKQFELFKEKWITDELKKRIFKLSSDRILCPISQVTRNNSKELALTKDFENQNIELDDFLKLHNKYARNQLSYKSDSINSSVKDEGLSHLELDLIGLEPNLKSKNKKRAN